MQCNIDGRGRRVRFASGLLVLAIAILLIAFWAWNTQSPLRWTIAAFIALIGGFMLFQGFAGWCAVRAMGFKTRQ